MVKVDSETLAYAILGSHRQVTFEGNIEYDINDVFVLQATDVDANCKVKVTSVEYKQTKHLTEIDAMQEGYTTPGNYFKLYADAKFVTIVGIRAVTNAS